MLRVKGEEFPMPRGTSPLTAASPIYPSNSWGPVEINMSNGESGKGDGTPLSVAGVPYSTGFGTNAPSQVGFRLNGTCSSFTAQVGIDDYFNRKTGTVGHGNTVFEVWGDGRLLKRSAAVKPGAAALTLKADVKDVAVLRLVARPDDNSNWFDYADWLTPSITCK
ncbi:NPCBM/NEW2 domain-containing protein [Candidatus Burkholderia verschuerenii]